MSKHTEDALENYAKQVGQQIGEQITQGIIQKGLATGEASLGYDSNKHDIDTDEAHKGSVLSQTRLWNWNDKAQAALEHKQDQQAFSIKQMMDQVAVANAQDIQAFQSALRWEYARFNNASGEPISPDSGSDEKDAAK